MPLFQARAVKPTCRVRGVCPSVGASQAAVPVPARQLAVQQTRRVAGSRPGVSSREFLVTVFLLQIALLNNFGDALFFNRLEKCVY